MRKKNLLFVFILNFPSLFSCQVIFNNDTPNYIMVTDIANTISQIVKPNESIKANENPDVHAKLIISMNIKPQYGFAKHKYLIEQIACANNHSIQLNASDIISGNIDTKILKLERK